MRSGLAACYDAAFGGGGVTGNDAQPGFAGSGPGQDVAGVVARLTKGDLALIVGSRVLALLPPDGARGGTGVRGAAVHALRERGREILSRPEARSAVLRNLDPGKAEELASRLVASGLAATAANEPRATEDPATWDALAGFLGLADAHSTAPPRPPSVREVAAAYALFPHQRDVATRAFERVGRGTGRVVIHMPTGSGKTRTAMHVVSRVLAADEPSLVVWLAASRELLEQAAEAFQSAWPSLGNRALRLHRFWGDHSVELEEAADGLVVAGLAKLLAWRDRNPHAFFRLAARTRLVVMDEAHQAVAPTYRALVEGLAGAGQADAVLGLTATPGRTWSEIARDRELSEFFGAHKVSLRIPGYENPVAFLLDEGYLARPRFRQIEYRPEAEPTPEELAALTRADDYGDEALERLAADSARNRAILGAILDLVNQGHSRIIVFGASVGNALDLSVALSGHGVEATTVSAETPSARRDGALRAFRRPGASPMVLCNFGVLTTGFDAPLTSAAVIARPTKSLVLYSQMVGRATRGPRAGGNATCEIRTVLDPAYPGFGSIAEAFFNWEDVWSDRVQQP